MYYIPSYTYVDMHMFRQNCVYNMVKQPTSFTMLLLHN